MPFTENPPIPPRRPPPGTPRDAPAWDIYFSRLDLFTAALTAYLARLAAAIT